MHVSLRNATPVIIENEEELAILQQDLHGLGCAGLLERPWNIKNKEFVQEFVMIWEWKAKRSNIFDSTMRDRLEEWTAGVWRGMYLFLPGRNRMANRTDKFVEGKFLHEVDPKDGFPVKECRNDRERRVLEFLVPIVHPDKPTRVTRTPGNTIFGALEGDRPID